MKRSLALLVVLAAAPAGAQTAYDPARAQPYDRQLPDYSDDDRAMTQGWSARSDDMRPGYAPPAPPGVNGGYRDDGRYSVYADGGYGYEDGDGGYGADAPPPPVRARSTRPARPRDAARIARWRARADACEAGDRAACDGPE